MIRACVKASGPLEVGEPSAAHGLPAGSNLRPGPGFDVSEHWTNLSKHEGSVRGVIDGLETDFEGSLKDRFRLCGRG